MRSLGDTKAEVAHTGAGIIFKGSGVYETDYKRSRSGSAASSKDGGGSDKSTKDSSSSSSSSDSKSSDS